MAQFNFTFDPNVSLEQRVGFEMAAAIWSKLLNDDVTVNLRVGATNQLGENGQAVGGAIPIFHDTHYGTYQQYLEADATTAEDDQVVDALQQGNTVDVTVDGEVIDGNTELMLTRAQAKALGMDEALVLEDGSTWDRDVLANPDGLDGYILINDSFDWHYDLTREADAPEGTLDFLTMALHEIGHSLGFVSGLDGLIDTFTMHSGEQRTEGITALDLMRHGDGDGIADLTFGDAAYFSIDGGQTSLAEFEEGNEYQASHWQRYQDALGIMDPTLGYQERTDISNLDLTALDAIGWDVDYDALANGLDLNALYDQAQQTVAGTFGVDVAAVETALTNGEDWQSLGYEAWFNAFKDQVMEQGWGTWFQGFENQILEQGWGTWFQEFKDQLLEQGWGTWFQDFEAELLEQGWGTWFQDLGLDDAVLNQMWGTWFQALEDQVFEQMWGTWFQGFEDQLLDQLWGTWFQDFEAQVLEQGWGTWFQNFETQILEQGWGTWFQDFEADMLNQSWGTWFQSFEGDTLNQSWGTWFQDFDAEILRQGWGTWFQDFESQSLNQVWGTWFQNLDTDTLNQLWGTWFQSIDAGTFDQTWGTWFQSMDADTFQQMWGTWFQKLDTEVLNQMWGTWFQSVDADEFQQMWGTWFQTMDEDVLEQMWGTWFQSVETETLNQLWGTWFQEMDADTFHQMWGTWFQEVDNKDLKDSLGNWYKEKDADDFQQMWGTWFQTADAATLNQLWGTWFQETDAEAFSQMWGTWFQEVDADAFNQLWGTWFQTADNATFDQMWGTWFQTVDTDTFNQMWGTWFQALDTGTFEQLWGTWFQSVDTATFDQMWGTWFQEVDTDTLNQLWGTWFQDIDEGLLEQGWGTWFQKFETQVLEQGWGTWFQQIEGQVDTLNNAISRPETTASGAITGGATDDILAGGSQHDFISGVGGDDLIDGQAGDDVIFGDRGNDILYGWTGQDLIFGGEGDDFIAGENGDDQLYGEAGHDILSGGRGDDYLYGGTGRDVLKGDTGNDVLAGGESNDQLSGGSGADLLIGGTGKDDLEGGSGDDILYGDDYFDPAVLEAPEGSPATTDQPESNPIVSADDAIAALGFSMRIEAEDMKLKNYSIDQQVDASGGSVIATQGKGNAETTFNGPSGTYDLVVGYQDQAGGTAEITLEIKPKKGPKRKYTWELNGGDGSGTHTISGITLEAGDEIKIKGDADGDADLARLDYLDIITPGSNSDGTGTSTGPLYEFVEGNDGQQADIRIEAEQMVLAGAYTQLDSSYASGDGVITALAGENGTATYTYQGETAVYNLYANYFDTALGDAQATVRLNGETLHSWTFDKNDLATHDETLAVGLTLNDGDVIQIEGEASWLDRAVIDYLVLEHSSSPATPRVATSPSSPQVLRVEAEDMTLDGKFNIGQKDFASGDALIQTGNKNDGLTASTTFTGATGLYNIVIGYYDRADGQAEYYATLGSGMLDAWVANQDIDKDLDASATTRTLSNVLLTHGDTFSLQSIRDGKDRGYIDYVEFVSVNSETTLPEGTLHLEVEQMNVFGGAIQHRGFASGGRYVEAQTLGSSFNSSFSSSFSSSSFSSSFSSSIPLQATSLFQGESGYYDIVVGYYDLEGGKAEIALKVDNQERDRWYADQDWDDTAGANSLTTRVIEQVKIDRYDLIELSAIADGADRGNLDYIQFIKVDAPEVDTTPVQPDPIAVESDQGDTLRGGAGNDTAYGGEGDDTVYGDDGDDILYGDNGGVSTDSANAAPTAGLVGHWAFDWNFDDTAGENVGTWANTNLEKQGSPAEWIVSHVNGGLAFDGSKDLVAVADSDALDITDTLTLSTWVKADAFQSWDGLIVKGTDNLAYALDLTSDGRLVFSANYGALEGASGSGDWYSDHRLTTGQWHHVAVTYDGSAIQFYVDGQLDTNVAQANLTFGVNDEALIIGADLAGGSHFDGALDDARVYDRALSADEIAQLANINTSGSNPAPSPSAGMQFDGDDALIADHTDAMLLNNGTLSFSFQADNVFNHQGLISKDSEYYDDGGHFTIYLESGQLIARFQSTNATYSASTWVSAGQDYDVAVTFGDRGIELWLDGILVDTNTYTGGLGTTSGGSGNREPIVLGANQWRSGNEIADDFEGYFSGTLRDVRLYDQQLSGTEITQLPSNPSTSANVVFEELVATPSAQGVGGNDTLIGGSGNDTLFGDAGADTLNGTDAAAQGVMELDRLTGGSGTDLFILGDADHAYYSTGGDLDYAVITDFTAGIDLLQLHGSVSGYSQSVQGSDLFLYYGVNQDLVAQFENTQVLNLNTDATFV